MGGGNGQKSKMAREKNLEKQKAAAKGSQLESNKKAMSIQVVSLHALVFISFFDFKTVLCLICCFCPMVYDLFVYLPLKKLGFPLLVFCVCSLTIFVVIYFEECLLKFLREILGLKLCMVSWELIA
ncbi:hypothetical protein J1N35_015839 [Gossypium stocksii]|uniref:Small EDRK-rich factor-like N-terminal domain-containing protein n=1 Tax=Gossypium stocksii TaxID=47602 RepID=A0A9D3VXM0_9ROSI|nr:hypothetical protein J1N35_015839 [Gossypium stocksii]